MMTTNNLDTIMNIEALSNAELARLSGLSERTIGKVRRKKSNPAENTKNKITRGLNDNPKKLKTYQNGDIFT